MLRSLLDHLSLGGDGAALDLGIDGDDGQLEDEQPPKYCPYTHTIDIGAPQMHPD